MNTRYRWLAVASLLVAAPRISTAASDCSRQIDDLQRHLQVFAREARPLGSGFLTDNGLGVSLDAFKKRLDGTIAQDRSSPAWSGLREAEEARTKLMDFDERLARWGEGIAGYASCLKNPSCSIGDYIKQQEISNRELAAWLKSIGDEGLEKATVRLTEASAVVNKFTANAGRRTTGVMAATWTCASENSPRSAAARVQEPVHPGAPATAAAIPAPAPGPTARPALSIEHQPVGCAAAERFPRLEARFTPADTIAKARVLFQGANLEEWYSVVMKPEGTAYAGILPKPKKSLSAFRYYIEVTDTALETSRTAEYTTSVVASASECKSKIMAGVVTSASVVLLGPAGAAAVPVGFASAGVVAAGSAASAAGATSAGGGGGLSTGAMVGIGAGVAGLAGVVAAKGGGDSNTTPSSSSPAPSAPAPTPTPAPPPTPSPTPGVAQYDGNYRGAYSGTFGGAPVSGPVAYSVSNGQLSLTEPGGGSGTVDASGSANFGGKGNVGGADCSFRGNFQGGTASGTWTCSGGGLTGNGNWNAQRQ
jgi:hypothetical protein